MTQPSRMPMPNFIKLLKYGNGPKCYNLRNEGDLNDAVHLARWLNAAANTNGVKSNAVHAVIYDHHDQPIRIIDPSFELIVIYDVEEASPRVQNAIFEQMEASLTRNSPTVVLVTTNLRMSEILATRALRIYIDLKGEMTPPLIHLMRRISGLDMMGCKLIAKRAAEELNGDYVVALLAAMKNMNAVMIRSRVAGVSDETARKDHNLRQALADRSYYVQKSESWAFLDTLSGHYVP